MKKLTFQIKSTIFILSVSAFFFQCEMDRFPGEYHDIYGNWTIRNISGGITGASMEPKFDILTIRHGMCFYLLRNDTLLSEGTIEIINETDDYLIADFNSEDNYLGISGVSKTIRLRHDTLVLSDNCDDCYSAYFVRNEIYSNDNYIQSSKTLDFVHVTNYPIGFNKYCNSVFFQTETLGFITCSDGTILKTNDGGKSWRQVESRNTHTLNGIAFINEQIGYAVGGIMLRTSDGGETWDSIPLSYNHSELRTIKFFSSSFGITLGNGARLLTRNGGQTWDSFVSNNMTAVHNLFLLNEDVAYLSGLKGQLFKTVNGGNTWRILSYNYPYYIQSIMFINEQKGFISFYDCLMKTSDGGLTWNRMEYAPISGSTMYFSSESNGIVFGIRTYATNKWDVWDAYFNILINGKWYGDERITSHCTPFCLNAKTFYTITWDNKLSVIKLTN